MPYAVIADQIEREFGQPPERLYTRFERQPFASASIGQVHRARTDDGREVIVKVQYPGVDTSVDSDLAHLKLALRASGLLKMKRQVINELFEEVRVHLHEELDYCNEADNVRLFRAHHAGDPAVVVPDVVGERSAKRVLTLTYEPGDSINDLDALGYPQDVRDRLGENLFRLTTSQLFELRALQSDPNPANFAFRRDGTVVLYDFGCIKHIKEPILAAYKDTIRAGLAGDMAGVEDGMIRLGARNVDGPPVELEYYEDWRGVLLAPFLRDEPFDYGASTIHHELKKRIPGVLQRLGSFQPPVELVFVDRVVAGHYWNLRKLRSRGHFLEHVRPHLGG
jgi:predicted unusual protein kinase regulating ubiquinone biosynthesis (AarF/ABC1/UbiB family)